MDDIIVAEHDQILTLTINRPDRMNAFRQKTVDEMNSVLEQASHRADIGVIVITGAGTKAFCTGGDVKEFTVGSGYSGASWTDIGIAVDRLHRLIRSVPQPVIAAVNGYAIGGGNVLQVVCDLSIASSKAIFGQVGPRYGSFDGGFGSAYLARLVGERKAREIWFLCRTYSADAALGMGLINCVVPPEKLIEEVQSWANEILGLSPTALKALKRSFNADSESIGGITQLSFDLLRLYYQGPEAAEGHAAFHEKRAPNYKQFRTADQQ